MPEDIPIIFVHYGPSAYLRNTLKAARQSNPTKRIILLGDESNRAFARGVEFVPYADYLDSPEAAAFSSVFTLLEGTKHTYNKHGGTGRWLRFCFDRWFVFHEFARQQRIERFWTFDSDTLIAADLQPREAALRQYDNTEQCCGGCMNGLVNRLDVVTAYLGKMTDLFRRPDYLQAQRERLDHHTGLAFNEMDAYQTYRAESGISTIHLGQPRDGEVFDDALAIVGGYQVHPGKVRGRTTIKRLFTHRDHGLFVQREDGTLLRLVTANLSWLPDYIGTRLLPFCAPWPVGATLPPRDSLEELDVREPLGESLKRQVTLARLKVEKLFSK